jgi:conjugal transfer pilus assembly protein TraK
MLMLVGLAGVRSAFAVQNIDGADIDRKEAVISLREPTRLAIEHGRIREVISVRGEIDKLTDEVAGQVFLTLPTDTAKPINIFVTDENNVTYSLMLVPQDVPAETIILRTSVRMRETGGSNKAPSYQRAVKNLILTMADSDNKQGGQQINTVIPLWENVRLVLDRRYNQSGLIGERYLLVNLSNEEIVIAEQEFYRRGVLAVAVEYHNLAPAQSTTIFVVRQRGDDD